MRLIMFTVVAATVAGLVAGGTLRDFPSMKLRCAWLALAGVVMQFVPLGGAMGTALLCGSLAKNGLPSGANSSTCWNIESASMKTETSG